MKRNLEVEAVLERSMRKQVRVRRLDESFDAGVWSRIEAEESRATPRAPARPVPASKAARWLFIVNGAGVACVAVILCVFLFQWLSGIQVDAALPDFSPQISEQNASLWSTGIAGAALLFGF